MSAPVQPAAAAQVQPQPAADPTPAKPATPAPAAAPSSAGPAPTPAGPTAPPPPVVPVSPVRIVVPAVSLPHLPANVVINATVGEPLPGGRISLQIQSSPRQTLQIPWPNPPAPGALVRFRLAIVGQTATINVLHQPPQRPSSPPTSHQNPARVGDVIRGTLQSAPGANAANTGRADPSSAAPAGTGPVGLRITAINPPGQHRSIPVQVAAGQSVPGQPTTSPSTAAKSPVSGAVVGLAGSTLSFVNGSIALDQPLRLAAGTQIVFRVESGRLPLAAHIPTSPLNTLANALPSLRDALDVLTVTAPDAAATVRDGAVPSTGPRLATGMLFFLSALAAGTLQSWLGEAATGRLQRLTGDARIGNLGDEFAHLARSATESLSGEWRAMAMPILHGDALANLRLFIHRGDAGESGEPAGTRFIVEADLTQLGPIQLDGLVPSPERFDLTLRSTRPLSPASQHDLRDLFTQAGTAANFAGHLTFEIQPALPTPALAETPHRSLGVFA